MPSVLILFAHPAYHKSRINKVLFKAVQGLDKVTCVDMYEESPHMFFDVPKEQARLVEHDIIVFQHPFYWYSSPAILKEWQDLVLEYDFAYGPNGNALSGKYFLSAITTGGSAEAYCRKGYNFFSIRELLTPFQQTAQLCGMTYLPPFVIHGAVTMTDVRQIRDHAEAFRKTIVMLRDGNFDSSILAQRQYLNLETQ